MINNKWDIKYLQTQIKLQHLIDTVYTEAAKEAALIGTNITIKDPEKIFTFDDYPATKNRVNTLLNTFAKNINATLVNGINTTWDISNNKNNELCEKVHRNAQTPAQVLQNQNARAAFIQRKQAGLNLSDRVWNYTNQFKNEIELTLDGSIRDGLTAPEAARQLKQYLKHPDKLFRRVRNKHGILKLSKRAAAFNPGQGVYRSSYKNARRLAATEINMAYRTADHIRWQEMDFVVGIKIELSNNHTCLDSKGHPRAFTDICDDLQGKYPKDFKFVGWHPHCRCHATPILKTIDEMNADTRSIIQGNAPIKPTDSKNSVSDVPDVFNKWIDKNRERANGWSSMPYFVRDNPQYVSDFRIGIYSAAEKKFTRAYHTSPAMKQSLTLFLDKKYPNIKNTEKAALIEYTRGDVSDFRHLNKELMQNSLSEFNVAFSELLSSVLSKLPTERATVYRTIRLNKTNLETWKRQAISQAETTFQGFTSTSDNLEAVNDFIRKKSVRRKNNETDVLLIIKSKTGHRISEFTKFPEQRELLFNKGMRLKFESVRETRSGRIIFQMTEI